MLEMKGSIFNQRPQAFDAITPKQNFRYTAQQGNVTELDRDSFNHIYVVLYYYITPSLNINQLPCSIFADLTFF